MKLAIEIGPITPSTLRQSVEWVQFAEKLGVDMAFSAEAWWSDALTDDCGAASPLVDSVEMVDIVFVERFGPTRSMVSKRAREPAVAAARAPR